MVAGWFLLTDGRGSTHLGPPKALGGWLLHLRNSALGEAPLLSPRRKGSTRTGTIQLIPTESGDSQSRPYIDAGSGVSGELWRVLWRDVSAWRKWESAIEWYGKANDRREHERRDRRRDRADHVFQRRERLQRDQDPAGGALSTGAGARWHGDGCWYDAGTARRRIGAIQGAVGQRSTLWDAIPGGTDDPGRAADTSGHRQLPQQRDRQGDRTADG